MTREEAIKLLSQIMGALLVSNSWLPSTDNPIKEAFGMAISALQAQESCNNLATDTISRQAAIDAIPQTVVDMFEDCRNCGLLYREDVVRILSDLPSVNIKRSKEGRINETEIL